MTNFEKVMAFVLTGYEDYKTARFLINNGRVLPGAIFACTSIEKLFKAILLTIKPNDKLPRVHLDRIERLKNEFSGYEQESVFDNLDSTFIEELGVIYKFRYYDNFNEPTSVGFLVNQFLAELDYTVLYMLSLFKAKKPDGSDYKWRLHIDLDTFDEGLLKNNYVLHSIDKKEFMNRETHTFCYYINPKNLQPIYLESKLMVKPGNKVKVSDNVTFDLPLYSGNIFLFRFNEETKIELADSALNR